jgi:hypothetical protein
MTTQRKIKNPGIKALILILLICVLIIFFQAPNEILQILPSIGNTIFPNGLAMDTVLTIIGSICVGICLTMILYKSFPPIPKKAKKGE